MPRLQLVSEVNKVQLFDINVTNHVTVLYDLSGTGKTALSNLCEKAQENGIELICDCEVVIISNIYTVTGLETDDSSTKLLLIDESATFEVINKAIKVAHTKGWYILLAERDLVDVIVQDRIAFCRLITIGNVKRLSYYKNNTMGDIQEVKEVICEDHTSGEDFYKMVLPADIPVNRDRHGEMGYHKIASLLRRIEPERLNGMLIIADGTTYCALCQAADAYSRLPGHYTCIFAFSSLEELLLNLSLFSSNQEIQQFNANGLVPS